MPTVPLPHDPDLDQLKRQARELQRAVRAEKPEACAQVAELHPDPPSALAEPRAFALSSAQLVTARRYGFASWPRLRRHVQVVAELTWSPRPLAADASPADRFLRRACLDYDDDQPAHRAEARQMLLDDPRIVDDSIATAAADADAVRVRRWIDADPDAVHRRAGPQQWPPLMYLAYARHDPDVGLAAVLATAEVLLRAGADPNAGYLWHGLPSAFTVLTGCFGEGELGPERQPRHPHSVALARALLAAGAEANDSQALYNRMFRPDDDHLEVLFEFGLGRGDGGPWRRRLGDAVESPTQLLRHQLDWAVAHDLVARVRLLADHGSDLDSPSDDGRRPVERAARAGHRAVVDLLVSRGARPPSLDPADALIGAALAGDRAEVDRIRAAHPGAVDEAIARRRSLVVEATSTGRVDAVELVVDLGFDVNASGRADVPSDQPWDTALHHAAMDGRRDLAVRLLALGADPDRRDARFDATPLGWARHGGQAELIELLEPVTAPEDAAQDRSGRRGQH